MKWFINNAARAILGTTLHFEKENVNYLTTHCIPNIYYIFHQLKLKFKKKRSAVTVTARITAWLTHPDEGNANIVHKRRNI